MRTELQIDVTIDGPTCLVRLTGELDATTCVQLRTAMWEICAAEHRQVVIDMGGLSFLSLAGLRVLSDVQTVLDGIGCRLALANPNRLAVRVLAITGLDRTFNVAPESAVETSSPGAEPADRVTRL